MAGKLVIYHGEPESYTAFISPEACITLDKYLDLRREHGEHINESSPLFRDKFDPVEALDNSEHSNRNFRGIRSNYHSASITGSSKSETLLEDRDNRRNQAIVMAITEHSIRQYYNSFFEP